MEDMSSNKDVWKPLLDVVMDAKGSNAMVMEMADHCSWADYVLIVSASSQTHMRGIYHRVIEYVKSQEEFVMNSAPGKKDENRWILMDLGSIVIHIMTEEAREYYNLEDVWFESPILFKEDYQSSSSS